MSRRRKEVRERNGYKMVVDVDLMSKFGREGLVLYPEDNQPSITVEKIAPGKVEVSWHVGSAFQPDTVRSFANALLEAADEAEAMKKEKT